MSPQLLSPSVVLVDVDATVDPSLLVPVAAAYQRQAIEDVAPIWGHMASVRAAKSTEPPRDDEWQMRLIKTPGQVDYLGYHTVTPAGMPIMYVLPWLCAQFGIAWSRTGSHELTETLNDAFINWCAQGGDGVMRALEVADPVEADEYQKDGVVLSNFVTPQWFSPPDDLTGAKFDFMGLCTAPYQLRDGGYISTFDSTGWKQQTQGEKSPLRKAMDELGGGYFSRGKRRAA